jgi:hypothetical protein
VCSNRESDDHEITLVAPGTRGLALWVGPGLARGGSFDIFSTGLTTPESISLVPSGFGSHSGDYLVPDVGAQTIWDVPSAGGTPSVLANVAPWSLRGGVFLPTSGWGAYSGQFLAVGDNLSATAPGIVAFDASGNPSPVPAAFGGQLASAAVAPGGFGTLGGQVFITAENGPVLQLNTNGQISTFATLSTDFSFRPFGIAFAPSGFGTASGTMLVSDGVTGRIAEPHSDGSITTFATVALLAGQAGLRQMAFSPAGFIPGFGSLLFVSVSGSGNGGGTLGDVEGLDASGNVVASLRTNLGLTKFDPRGLLFTASGSLLISDTSDPVYAAQPSAFQLAAVPEPASSLMFGTALSFGGIVVARRSRSRRSRPGL